MGRERHDEKKEHLIEGEALLGVVQTSASVKRRTGRAPRSKWRCIKNMTQLAKRRKYYYEPGQILSVYLPRFERRRVRSRLESLREYLQHVTGLPAHRCTRGRVATWALCIGLDAMMRDREAWQHRRERARERAARQEAQQGTTSSVGTDLAASGD